MVLGFMGYYRRCIQEYDFLVRHFNDLSIRHPANKTALKDRKQQTHLHSSYGETKNRLFTNHSSMKLTQPSSLAKADCRLLFKLLTDVSQIGLVAVLYPTQSSKNRVVAYLDQLMPVEETSMQ